MHASNNDGWTAVMGAARYGQVAALKWLVLGNSILLVYRFTHASEFTKILLFHSNLMSNNLHFSDSKNII